MAVAQAWRMNLVPPSVGNHTLAHTAIRHAPVARPSDSRSGSAPARQRIGAKLFCLLIGHHISRFDSGQDSESVPNYYCSCGVRVLRQDDTETRVRHNVACFIGGHHYVRMDERDGHHEFVCRACGHPLLFEVGASVYARLETFRKKVRYLCNLFGHRAHLVAERGAYTEHACRCGHSFMKRGKVEGKIKHPLICLFAGHFVGFVTARAGYAEYLCRNCGHTFCFAAWPEK